MPGISLVASSIKFGNASRSASGLCATVDPNSANKPRMRLMQAVRSSL
jgi:hypothetical protein